MKRILTLFVLLLSFSVSAVAGSIHSVEVTPLAKASLLTSSDFASADVSGTGEKAVLSIKLTDSAARRMKTYTTNNVGRELPFLVDGKVIKAPIVRVPIEGNGFQVEPLDRALADEVAQFINSHR